MILADENVHSFIVEALREAGFQVVSVRESGGGITDAEVIQIAQGTGYLLLTEDKDFGEWIFAHHVSDLSVLFVRYEYNEFKDIAYSIVRLLNTTELKRPFFATVTTKKIRIRKL